MNNLIIHPRIHERHPEIEDAHVKSAFNNIFAQAYRCEKDAEEYMAIGSDANGRLLEMVYRVGAQGNTIVYHAFTPPTQKALYELGLAENKKRETKRRKQQKINKRDNKKKHDQKRNQHEKRRNK